MKTRAHVCLLISIASIAISLLSRPMAYGQALGHYIAGATSLENDTVPPPGVFVTYLPYVPVVDALKGPGGNTILNPDITIAIHNAVYSANTEKKILGAHCGLAFIVPVVNTRFTANVFDIVSLSGQYGGLSDVYFAPVILGWQKGNATYIANYGFYALSGDFDPSRVLNPGLGFWEHPIQAGTTDSIGKKRLWNTSLLIT